MKYENNGRFNQRLVSEALDTFCQKTNRDRSGITFKDSDFIDFVLSECLLVATGRSVLNFLKKAQEMKIQNGNKYSPYQIECILKTYTNIMLARNWKGWNE